MTAIINTNIDPLINTLEKAHIYYLNDTTLVIKLNKNKQFKQFLLDRNIYPKFKSNHGDNQKFHRNKRYNNGDNIPDPFINMVMIKNGNNNIDLICCDLFIEDQERINFINKSDTGAIINGTFFLYEGGIRSNFFDLGRTKPQLFRDKTPIGPYQHSLSKLSTTKLDPYNNVFVSELFDKGQMMLTKQSVLFAEDVLGMIIIHPDSKIEIVTMNDFNTKLPTLSDKCQYMYGNLLINNNDIVFKDDLVNIVYNLIPIADLPELSKCKLCEKIDGTGDFTYEKHRINDDVFIKNLSNNKVYKIKYNDSNLFSPYCVDLYRKIHGDSFGGKVLPGVPSHASDLNPRTCVFIDENDHVFFMHIEGRNFDYGGIGLDLFDLTKMCKELGAKYAINLDGGGTSILSLKEKDVDNVEHIGLKGYDISNAIKITPK
jgi:hypothetical protein